MARSQSQLQKALELASGLEESSVFLQPPTVLPYPCIKYERDDSYTVLASNIKYLFLKRYQVTVIDRKPNSPIPDSIEALPHCRFDRFFVASGLNHWVYSIYF